MINFCPLTKRKNFKKADLRKPPGWRSCACFQTIAFNLKNNSKKPQRNHKYQAKFYQKQPQSRKKTVQTDGKNSLDNNDE